MSEPGAGAVPWPALPDGLTAADFKLVHSGEILLPDGTDPLDALAALPALPAGTVVRAEDRDGNVTMHGVAGPQ